MRRIAVGEHFTITSYNYNPTFLPFLYKYNNYDFNGFCFGLYKTSIPYFITI